MENLNPKLGRRTFLTSLSAASLRSFSCSPLLSSNRPPNLIIVITDDQGYGDIGFHGNRFIRTPNLDKFAKEGIEFSRFYVCPVCAPTRASLLTGRYTYRTGVVDTYLGRAMMHNDEVTLAEVLRKAGYRTAIFGKWHLGDNYPLRPSEQGFEHSLVHRGGGIGQPSDPPGNCYFDPLLLENGTDVRKSGYCTDIFFQAALRFIEEHRNEPFFIYLSTNAPHTPLQVPYSYVEPYKRMGLDETTARIYGMVTNIDENFGRLIQQLQRLGLYENTVLLFLTDNGPQQHRYNAGLRGLKGSVYEGGIRVPCFMQWKARYRNPARITTMATCLDVFPTLLEFCGLQPPSGLKIDGRSLIPLLEHRPGSYWEDRLYFVQWHRGDVPEPGRACAVVGGRFKLVQERGARANEPFEPKWELLDLENDPAEKDDLSAQEPDLVKHLREKYEQWYEDVKSTRHFEPPKIYLGTSFESPVVLTRQDWRGPKASWGPDGLGHWLVDVRKDSAYRIRFLFPPVQEPGAAVFRLANTELKKQIRRGETEVWFENVRLPKGPATLEAILDFGRTQVGVHYVHVWLES